MFFCVTKRYVVKTKAKRPFEESQTFQRTLSLFLKMTTRSQKKKAVEELASADLETPLSGDNQTEIPLSGTSKSSRIQAENLKEIKSTLKKENCKT